LFTNATDFMKLPSGLNFWLTFWQQLWNDKMVKVVSKLRKMWKIWIFSFYVIWLVKMLGLRHVVWFDSYRKCLKIRNLQTNFIDASIDNANKSESVIIALEQTI
jgi:hypothetical protein